MTAASIIALLIRVYDRLQRHYDNEVTFVVLKCRNVYSLITNNIHIHLDGVCIFYYSYKLCIYLHSNALFHLQFPSCSFSSIAQPIFSQYRHSLYFRVKNNSITFTVNEILPCTNRVHDEWMYELVHFTHVLSRNFTIVICNRFPALWKWKQLIRSGMGSTLPRQDNWEQFNL